MSVLVLGPVVGALLQAEVICYLCPAQGHLVELQSDLRLAAMCVGPRGLWKRARCNLRLATKAQGIPRVTTTCLGPADLGGVFKKAVGGS